MDDQATKIKLRQLQQKIDDQKRREKTAGNPAIEKDDKAIDVDKIRYHQLLLQREELLTRLQTRALPRQAVIEQKSMPELRQINHEEREKLQKAVNKHPKRECEHFFQSDTHKTAVKETQTSSHLNRKEFETQTDVQSWPDITTRPPQALITPLEIPLYTSPPIRTSVHRPELYDMLMLQNSQMHQYFMHHLLLNKQPAPEVNPIVIDRPAPQIVTIPEKQPSWQVQHHHYYNKLPPIPPIPPIPPVEKNPQDKKPEERPSTPDNPLTVREKGYESYTKQVIRKPPTSKPPEPKEEKRHPFPGSRALRKLRHIFYAAWFISFLRVAARKRSKEPTNKFLFGIQLKEALAAVHRIYLNPEGTIYPLLRDSVATGTIDLTDSFLGNQRAQQELVYILENILYNITDIMPQTGVLGTHKKAVVFEMIKSRARYPDGYFWEVEKDMLHLDEDGRTIAVSTQQAQMLLIGLFISRSLVTTLLMKPLDYGLSVTILDGVAERNLRLLASVLLYIVRRASSQVQGELMPMPYELSTYVFSDIDLSELIGKINKSVSYGSQLLQDWSREYVSRLRTSDPNRYNLLAK